MFEFFRLNIKNIRFLFLLFGISSLFLIGGWFLNQSFQEVNDQNYWVTHTVQVLEQTGKIQNSISEAESAVRGYVLMNDSAYLQPYQNGRVTVMTQIEDGLRLSADNPLQTTAFTNLKGIVRDRFELLDSIVQKKTDGTLNPKNLISLMSEGRIYMENIRDRVRRIGDSERELLERRSARLVQSQNSFTVTLVLTLVGVLIVVVFAFMQVKKNQDSAEREALEKERESELQERVSEAARRVAGDPSIESAANAVLDFLAQKFNVLASKLFLLERGQLRLVAAQGTASGNTNEFTGLPRQALGKKEFWIVNDVPETYWKIESSLGHSKPTALGFLPLVHEDHVVGVIEIGSFKAFSDLTVLIMNQLSTTLGVGMSAAQSKEKLHELLVQTQRQSEELMTQQEELKANNEELEQQARALESQQRALNLKNQELESAHKDLETKAADLHRSSQYKSDFLAKMSHELRTPLNSLLILSTLLTENKERNLSDQQIQFAQSIHTAGNDLLELINDILDLSKIEARKLVLRPESFPVNLVLKQLQHTFSAMADKKGIKLTVAAENEAKDQILYTDRLRLEQVLRNFLSNALKFTDKGTVSIEAKIDRPKNTIHFNVLDSGIGIPREKLDLIFQAFEQVDSSSSRKYGGTGLGLTISRELAHLLEGEITVESIEGKGSMFSLVIPLRLSAAPVATVAKEAPALVKSPAPDLPTPNAQNHADAQFALEKIVPERKSILVIEDDSTFRHAVNEVVESYGYQIIEASDALTALEILKDHIPSAIVLDIKLPGMSGLGLLDRIKQDPRLRHVPVHVVSATEYQMNALKGGAIGYLTKPVSVDNLRNMVDRIESLLSVKVRKVLVVEDDEIQSQAIHSLIADEDVNVQVANTGRQALEYLRHNVYDCVVLDLNLPDISGFELLSEFNSLQIKLPPIVVYTARELTAAEEEYLRKFSESIIIKGARSPERLLDEVNLFVHRVETRLPEDKQKALTQMRLEKSAFKDKTVLLVDDDMRNLFALTSGLESRGLQVRIAKNGFEALEALEEYKDISLVLMDIMMPKMDGYEAIRRVRESTGKSYNKVPIIALTAKAMRDDHDRCIEAGANDYLPKPVNLENLMTVLHVWLSSDRIL